MKNYYKLKDEITELQLYVRANTSFEMVICTTEYPMTITFREKQIDMFEENESKNAPTLCFVFDHEMRIVASENLKIDETVFNKLKSKSKAINSLYLHAFREEVAKVFEPTWETTFGSQVCLYNKSLFERLMNFNTDE